VKRELGPDELRTANPRTKLRNADAVGRKFRPRVSHTSGDDVCPSRDSFAGLCCDRGYDNSGHAGGRSSNRRSELWRLSGGGFVSS
jgi:hypothetical protein